jgi:transposase
MRKSFDGLYGIIKSDLNRDVRDGGLFMFLNQRLNRLKILYWDTDGIAIWMKRLEQGCFQRPLRCADGKHVIITHAELQCILSGVDLKKARGLSPGFLFKSRYRQEKTLCRESDGESHSSL